MSHEFDIAVIGGGVMGCAALHYLARHGCTNSVLVERETIGSGSTARSMTILRMHYSNSVATEMSWWSREVMENFRDHVGFESGFVQNGWMMLPEQGNRDGATANYRIAVGAGVETELLDQREAKRRWEYMDFSSVDPIVWEPLSGYADSHLVTSGFANSARSMGAEIRQNVEVRGFRTRGRQVVGIETEEGEIRARAFVLSAGPWTSDMLGMLDVELPLGYVRHQVTRIQRPRSFAESAVSDHPTVAHVPSGLVARPDTPGATLIGYREDPVERDSYNRSAESGIAAESMQVLSRLIPSYSEATWNGGWAGIFTVTPDWNPVIDRVQGYENVVVGAGFSGHGFKMSPAVGLSLAELALEHADTTFDLRPLRWARFEEGDLLRSSYGGTVFA